jgi:hypothetical protein
MYVADAIKKECSVYLVYSVRCPLSTKLDLPHENVKLIQTRQARSCNNCCCGKAISITYFECVFVALVIRHEMSMGRIVIRGLLCCKMFPHISQTVRFSKRSY